jgi:hypothetical protein
VTGDEPHPLAELVAVEDMPSDVRPQRQCLGVGAGCNAMRYHGALGVDMHRSLGFLKAADQDLLDRLLDGRLDPASAPPGYGRLARLLAAATAPAAPEELAGEQRVLAEFTAVMRLHPPTLVPRRTAVPRKVLTMKAAAAALVAVLSIGGVAAAASGLLPDQASPVAEQAPATTGADAAAHGLGKPAAAANLGGSANAGSANGGSADGQGQASAVGPDATGTARAGLCRAWQAGQGGDHGRRMDAVAFQALVDAARGADKVAAYCQDVAAGSGAGDHGQGRPSPPSVSAPPTSVSPPSRGPPADPGSPASTAPGGRGQGGPPTTTG